jgi:hypothetical protein
MRHLFISALEVTLLADLVGHSPLLGRLVPDAGLAHLAISAFIRAFLRAVPVVTVAPRADAHLTVTPCAVEQPVGLDQLLRPKSWTGRTRCFMLT